MRTPHCKEWRLKERLSVRSQHAYIGHRQKFFIEIQFILDALIPADVKMPADQMRGRLDGGLDGDLRYNIGENLAFFIILNTS